MILSCLNQGRRISQSEVYSYHNVGNRDIVFYVRLDPFGIPAQIVGNSVALRIEPYVFNFHSFIVRIDYCNRGRSEIDACSVAVGILAEFIVYHCKGHHDIVVVKLCRIVFERISDEFYIGIGNIVITVIVVYNFYCRTDNKISAVVIVGAAECDMGKPRIDQPASAEEGNPAGLSSCSGGLRPLVELCVEPAGLCGRCTGVSLELLNLKALVAVFWQGFPSVLQVSLLQ